MFEFPQNLIKAEKLNFVLKRWFGEKNPKKVKMKKKRKKNFFFSSRK